MVSGPPNVAAPRPFPPLPRLSRPFGGIILPFLGAFSQGQHTPAMLALRLRLPVGSARKDSGASQRPGALVLLAQGRPCRLLGPRAASSAGMVPAFRQPVRLLAQLPATGEPIVSKAPWSPTHTVSPSHVAWQPLHTGSCMESQDYGHL